MEIVPVRGRFAVKGGQPYYLFEGSKRACQGFIDRCHKQRADLAAFEAEKEARTAAKLRALGIGPINYRKLQPGDLYATSPDGPVHEVTRVRHMASGASQAFHETTAVGRACGDMGHLLLTSGFPVYGLLRGEPR